MLAGLSPILLFQFKKISLVGSRLGASLSTKDTTLATIPLISDLAAAVQFPPIPIYLDPKLTGLHMMSQSKNIDIDTNTEGVTSDSEIVASQKTVASTVTIEMEARRDSVGLILLSALLDVVFSKVSAKEYSVTYLNGATTIFGGLLHSFAVNENADNDKCTITLTLLKGKLGKLQPEIKNQDAIKLSTSTTPAVKP